MQEPTALLEADLSRSRESPSPPYPAIGLRRILERVAPLATAPTTKAVSERYVLDAIGFGTMNGTSKLYLNSARQFGLLTAAEGGFVVAPEIGRIERTKNRDAKRRLIAEVAYRPSVFQALRTLHPHAIGEGQEQARQYLSAQGFRAAAVEAVMSSYRSTLTFLGQLDASADGGERPLPEVGKADATVGSPDRAPYGSDGSTIAADLAADAVRRAPGEAPSARILFQYGFERAGGIRLCADGDVRIKDVLDVITAWIDIKRAELKRLSHDLPAEPDIPQRVDDRPRSE